MNKRSPRQIALLISLYASLFINVLLFLSLHLFGIDFPLYLIPLTFIISFLSIFIISFLLIKKFIHDKIQLIYKNIHYSFNSPTSIEKLDMNSDILEEVNDEVSNWAQKSNEEIARLKREAEFRREFIGNLAHELKTPVFSIQGYILTLLEGGLEDEKVNRDFLERANRGVVRMTGIIEDLDTITQFESGKLDLTLEKVDIVELTKEVIESLEMKATDKNVELAFKDKYEKPVYVLADEGRISQVLTNLIANSINYSSDNGKTEIKFYDMDDHILTEITDNGIGISEEHLPRLFERFYRVDKSRARHKGGTGLGLSIVKHILDAHKQTIHVKSKEGVGTTFTFTLKKYR
jgi:two-component system, OmpR family, phosphate regulon sensor histidine kinase PhoR